MNIVKNRVTVRQFDSTFTVPDDHYNLIIEAARHAPREQTHNLGIS